MTQRINPSSDSQMGEVIRWVIESSNDPSKAAADWLVRDINPSYSNAFTMLSDPDVPLSDLRQAKSAFKTMRIVGETAGDRRLAAHLYVATIAAALVHHGKRISAQSERAIRKALSALEGDADMPGPLRGLAGAALNMYNNADPGGTAVR